MASQTWVSRKLEEKSEEVSKMSSERLGNGNCKREWNKIQMYQIEEIKDNCKKAIFKEVMAKNFPEFVIKLILKIKMSNWN